MMSSLQKRVTEATSSAPTQPNNTHTNTNNTTNIEACFSTGLDLSDFGGNINASPTAAAANTAPSASAALAKIKSDAAAKIRREEQEEAALERRVAAVDVLVPSRHNESNNDSKDAIMPRALHPNSQPSSMAGEERDNNFIQFQQTSGGNCDFLSSLVTTHKSEGREISNKSRMMLKSNSKGNAKPGHNSGCASSVGGVSSRRSRRANIGVKQKASGKSVVKKSFKLKSKF